MDHLIKLVASVEISAEKLKSTGFGSEQMRRIPALCGCLLERLYIYKETRRRIEGQESDGGESRVLG